MPLTQQAKQPNQGDSRKPSQQQKEEIQILFQRIEDLQKTIVTSWEEASNAWNQAESSLDYATKSRAWDRTSQVSYTVVQNITQTLQAIKNWSTYIQDLMDQQYILKERVLVCNQSVLQKQKELEDSLAYVEKARQDAAVAAEKNRKDAEPSPDAGIRSSSAHLRRSTYAGRSSPSFFYSPSSSSHPAPNSEGKGMRPIITTLTENPNTVVYNLPALYGNGQVVECKKAVTFNGNSYNPKDFLLQDQYIRPDIILGLMYIIKQQGFKRVDIGEFSREVQEGETLSPFDIAWIAATAKELKPFNGQSTSGNELGTNVTEEDISRQLDSWSSRLEEMSKEGTVKKFSPGR